KRSRASRNRKPAISRTIPSLKSRSNSAPPRLSAFQLHRSRRKTAASQRAAGVPPAENSPEVSSRAEDWARTGIRKPSSVPCLSPISIYPQNKKLPKLTHSSFYYKPVHPQQLANFFIRFYPPSEPMLISRMTRHHINL